MLQGHNAPSMLQSYFIEKRRTIPVKQSKLVLTEWGGALKYMWKILHIAVHAIKLTNNNKKISSNYFISHILMALYYVFQSQNAILKHNQVTILT